MLVSQQRSVHFRSPWRCEHPYAVSKDVTVRCRRRDCRGCGRWWSQDQREKLKRNLGSVAGHMALVTITAPGQDVLPWDGYRVYDYVLKPWNQSAPARWRELHKAAAKRAQREARRLNTQWAVLAQVWQEQKRGALHRHAVVPMATVEQRAVSKVYVDALHALAVRNGFGFVDRKLELRSPERCSAYIARYVSSELAMCRQLPGHVVEVNRRLTSRTGVTVRSLRAERRLWCVALPRARLDSEGQVATQLRLCDVPRRTTRERNRGSPRRVFQLHDGSWGIGLTQAELGEVWGPILGG